MAYQIDMKSAATRHFNDGRLLEESKRFDNAAYHFGLSTECIVKGKLLAAGVRGDSEVIWKHFPMLLHLAEIAARGRGSASLQKLLSPQLMKGWDVQMRYAKNGSVSEAQVTKWRIQANSALGLLYE